MVPIAKEYFLGITGFGKDECPTAMVSRMFCRAVDAASTMKVASVVVVSQL